MMTQTTIYSHFVAFRACQWQPKMVPFCIRFTTRMNIWLSLQRVGYNGDFPTEIICGHTHSHDTNEMDPFRSFVQFYVSPTVS